ncbi:hypothetical protein L3Q82_015738, partial [Scortum barcoo]
ETDLNKLQMQHRRADAAKRAYTEKTQGLICRDRREIQRLQHEREELLRSLRVSQSCFNRWTDASVVQDLSAMLACRDTVDEELEAEKGKEAYLKDQILKWEKKLEGQRTSRGITHCSMSSDNSNLLKSVQLLENKLHRSHKCFNKLMTSNEELREELKTLQMEKKKFLHVRSRLENELSVICKDICKLMTKCTEAFNASVKFHEKHRMLSDQNAKDVAQYVKERGNLEREISHCCNFKAFVGKKAIRRSYQDTDHRKVLHKQLDSKELGLADSEEVLRKIFRETEESDLDKLINNFIQTEEQNYTSLNFVICQQNKVESIRREISQLSCEREVFVAEEQQQQEQHRALWMRVSIKQEAVGQQLAVYEQRVESMEKLLHQFKEGVKSLLQISYDGLVVFDQLDSSDGVQDENISEYIRMVEDRVNELLTLQSYLHYQENFSQWDIDGLSTISGQLLGIPPEAVTLTIAAATPAPE